MFKAVGPPGGRKGGGCLLPPYPTAPRTKPGSGHSINAYQTLLCNKLGHSQTLTPPLLSAAGSRIQTAYGLALMKRKLIVQEDSGQGQESHSPPSCRAAAPRLIPPGCKSGAGSHSIPGGSISRGRSAGHQPLPHPVQTARRPDTGDACAQEPDSYPPGP